MCSSYPQHIRFKVSKYSRRNVRSVTRTFVPKHIIEAKISQQTDDNTVDAKTSSQQTEILSPPLLSPSQVSKSLEGQEHGKDEIQKQSVEGTPHNSVVSNQPKEKTVSENETAVLTSSIRFNTTQSNTKTRNRFLSATETYTIEEGSFFSLSFVFRFFLTSSG